MFRRRRHMPGLVVEEEVGLELAQELALRQTAEEHRFVDLQVPLHQRADRPFVRRRAACGDERGAYAHAVHPLVLEALHRLQREPVAGMRLRTALVTARSAPAHERAVRTLMDWQIEIDEAMFLGGLAKGIFLREFEPDFFFDDQTGHIENAALHVPSGHVASGVRNP